MQLTGSSFVMRGSYISSVIIIILISLLSYSPTLACEIYFNITGEEKEIYDAGDEIVVLLEVKFTHQVCPEGILLTDYVPDGLEIAAATKWKETSPGVWKRKLKLKVTGNESGKLSLSARRTCDKEGGYGIINFKSNPVKIALESKTKVAGEN